MSHRYIVSGERSTVDKSWLAVGELRNWGIFSAFSQSDVQDALFVMSISLSLFLVLLWQSDAVEGTSATKAVNIVYVLIYIWSSFKLLQSSSVSFRLGVLYHLSYWSLVTQIFMQFGLGHVVLGFSLVVPDQLSFQLPKNMLI